MERKRKLPARAAARVEHVSKKRNSTPPDASTTSAPSSALTSPQPAESVAQEPPPPSSASAALPKSLTPGHPLPTVEKPQPDDLSQKDFQSVQESGVMAESLSRSRQKWIHDGVFEKYWTKPTKRKGVVKEDSNNPAKDTMTKIGQITITVEPHLLEATMYAVKEPRLAPTSNSTFRPIIQYGPPNGAMPPPPKPTTTSTAAAPAATPATVASRTPAVVASPSQPPVQTSQPAQPSSHSVPSREHDKLPTQQLPPASSAPSSLTSTTQQTDLQRPQLPTPINNTVASPRGLESVLAAPQPAHAPVPGPSHSRPPQPALSQPPAPTHPLHAPNQPQPPPNVTGSIPPGPVAGPKTTPPPPKPAASPASGADPIIVTLAERASEDPHLRDLMKRVAVGEAAAHELAHFQRIIDQITLDYKKKGGQQGPSPDRLIVDSRTVKYFADEVRNILEIILTSNPNQRSSDLRPPPGSDPLVILLVKETLDKPNTKALVQRVAEGKTKFSDAVDLKGLLDRLHTIAKNDAKAHQATTATNSQATSQTTATQVKTEDASKKSPTPAPASQQALRSKGPPPSAKPDIAAVVLEFAGGTGDRYLFPKYSILEFSAEGTQVVASFLIVRRGSKLEYGGDRELDYYQPVTLRIHSHAPKVLENLARVVAPQDEVQRYMDDVMENMTRAEYILLAMRLPRVERDDPVEERSDTPKVSETSYPTQSPGVLWDNRPTSGRAPSAKLASAKPTSEDERYQNFIKTVS
ncbi:hypothetical protein F5Y10DRAFT_247336 [Nemania abortiva]|nr:hypothetical protein F5Y10DRAFT_247336 [Nemania abortiva]